MFGVYVCAHDNQVPPKVIERKCWPLETHMNSLALNLLALQPSLTPKQDSPKGQIQSGKEGVGKKGREKELVRQNTKKKKNK